MTKKNDVKIETVEGKSAPDREEATSVAEKAENAENAKDEKGAKSMERAETSRSTEAELAEALKSAAEFKDLAQRVQAEFDNYRKRNAESVKNARSNGVEDVMEKLFPVADSFERGLDAVGENVKIGFDLIYRQLLDVFDKFDVKEIDALGKEFDPKYHHAVAQAADEEKTNVVIEVFQKGYIRKNKVLRPSLVKVTQ